jgi:hypothetical protein
MLSKKYEMLEKSSFESGHAPNNKEIIESREEKERKEEHNGSRDASFCGH